MAYETGLDKSDKYSSSFEKKAELEGAASETMSSRHLPRYCRPSAKRIMPFPCRNPPSKWPSYMSPFG